MTATTATQATTTTIFAREGINFGRALAALTAGGIREHDARLTLATAARTGISAVAGRNSGWTVMSGPGRTFTVMQESFLLS